MVLVKCNSTETFVWPSRCRYGERHETKVLVYHNHVNAVGSDVMYHNHDTFVNRINKNKETAPRQDQRN